VNQSRGHPEFMMMVMSFPKDLDILENPNIWVADTAATCDSTPHHQGAINLREGNSGVIFGDGRNNEAETTFDLPGIVTDQYRNEVIQAMLRNVKHVKSARFNLFSITKRQKDSWLLSGNSKKIWTEKGEYKIVFDIQIETPEGLIFALHHKRKETGKEINAAGPEKQVIKISINKAHQILGHMNKDMCCKMCKALGWD
jgi:hypothetical protein